MPLEEVAFINLEGNSRDLIGRSYFFYMPNRVFYIFGEDDDVF